MSRIAYSITIGILGVLLVLIALLLFRGPGFTTDATNVEGSDGAVSVPDLQVTCGSVVTVGWPGDSAVLNEFPHSYTSFHVEPSVSLPSTLFDSMASGFDQECNERRDTNIAFSIVLVIPVCVLSVLAVTRLPRPVDDDQPEPSPVD